MKLLSDEFVMPTIITIIGLYILSLISVTMLSKFGYSVDIISKEVLVISSIVIFIIFEFFVVYISRQNKASFMEFIMNNGFSAMISILVGVIVASLYAMIDIIYDNFMFIGIIITSIFALFVIKYIIYEMFVR